MISLPAWVLNIHLSMPRYSRPASRGHGHHATPVIEGLEGRQLLSAYTIRTTTGTQQEVYVKDDPRGGLQLEQYVTVNGRTTLTKLTLPRDTSHITFYGADRNDRFEVVTRFPLTTTLYGNGGNDTLIGGAGQDVIYAGRGDDILQGGQGDDSLYGEDGNDRLFGQAGTDRLYGGGSNDHLDGGHDDAVDYVVGGPGADTFVQELYTVGGKKKNRETFVDFSSREGDRLA